MSLTSNTVHRAQAPRWTEALHRYGALKGRRPPQSDHPRKRIGKRPVRLASSPDRQTRRKSYRDETGALRRCDYRVGKQGYPTFVGSEVAFIIPGFA